MRIHIRKGCWKILNPEQGIHPNIKKINLINLNQNIFFQKELLYKEVLYTIRNKVGGGQGNQFLILKDELYSYAKEAFQYTDETHARLMELATEEKVIFSFFLQVTQKCVHCFYIIYYFGKEKLIFLKK